ncbi:unnamed protein product, partial [marine sediment metagenome]
TWDPFDPGTSVANIALHPTDPDTIYASGFREGINKTTDGGSTWQLVNDGLMAVIPSKLAADPHQPDVVYATEDYAGYGVYKGTRGGAVWQFLEIEGARGINSVLVDPFTEDRVYAGAAFGVHRSEDGGQTWPIYRAFDPPPPEICKQDDPLGVDVLRAHPDPAYSDTLLAGVSGFCNQFSIQVGGIYRSTNGGLDWTLMNVSQEISPVTDLAYDHLIPEIVYAATDGGGMLRSADGGQSWQPMAEGIQVLEYARSIAVEPSPPYRIFAWT